MHSEMRENTVRAVVDAFTADERFDNNLESKLIVTGPATAKGKGERREVPMRRTAPGRYEAELRLDEYGSFLLRAEHARIAPDGALQPFATSFGHVSNPYPREYGRFEPDVELQTRAAAAAGGSLDPEASRVFDPQGEKIVYYRPLWSRFVLAAIVVFLLDLLVRRVRLFDRKFLPRRSLPPPPRSA